MPAFPARSFLPATCLISLFLLSACGSPGAVETGGSAPVTRSGQEPAFVSLLDTDLEGWQVVNADPAVFAVVDGVLQVIGDRGWLQSPRAYTDFILRLEFRFLEPSSDSGVFVRVEEGTEFILGWPGDSYQVQVRDISENPGNNPLPLGQVYRHVVPDGLTRYDGSLVSTAYTGVGEWQSLEITVLGRTLAARLNGQVVTTAEGLDNLSGYIGFQSERGIVEYRNIEIHEF